MINSAQAGITSTLTTTFNADARTSGNMFNIAANRQVRIVDLDCSISAPAGTLVNYQVYTIPDTYIGKYHYAPSWTLRRSGSTLSIGIDMPSPLGANLDILMTPGTSLGFYVLLTANKLRSTRTHNVNGVAGINNDMAISHGIGLELPFSVVSHAQIWNGTVNYFNQIGTAYCFGDGSGAACPCGNNGQPGSGCTNSSSYGAITIACGSPSIAAGDLSFSVRNIPVGRPALLISGTNHINSGLGFQYGDGISCVGGNLQFYGVRFIGPDGIGFWDHNIVAQGHYISGTTQYYQVLFRDSYLGSPCGTYFNLSNGVSLGMLP